MKTKYKWIVFELFKPSKHWLCFNKEEDHLGDIEYNVGWRQFVFEPHIGYGSTIFNFRCLEDIVDFLKQLNKTKGCYKEKGE